MRIVVLIIGLTVMALGVAALGATGFEGRRVIDEVEQTFSAAAGRLTVRGFNGRVTYEPWDGDEIRVVATLRVSAPTPAWARRVGERVHIEMDEADGHIRTEAIRPAGWLFFGNVAVQFHVYVPAQWEGVISLTTSNGPITAHGLRGDAALRTSNGKVVVEGHQGMLQVRTSNGRLELSDVRGQLQAQSSNGTIRVLNSVLSGTGRVKSSNGSVTFEAQLAPDAAYDVTTSNGSVSIMLAEPDVSLSLRTSNGRIQLQTDVNVSDVDRHRLSGRIGSGASSLNVRTSNGPITLDAKRSGNVSDRSVSPHVRTVHWSSKDDGLRLAADLVSLRWDLGAF